MVTYRIWSERGLYDTNDISETEGLIHETPYQRGNRIEGEIAEEYENKYDVDFKKRRISCPIGEIPPAKYRDDRHYTYKNNELEFDLTVVDNEGLPLVAFEVYDGSYNKGREPVMERALVRIMRPAALKIAYPYVIAGTIFTDKDVYDVCRYTFISAVASELGVSIIYEPREKYFHPPGYYWTV